MKIRIYLLAVLLLSSILFACTPKSGDGQPSSKAKKIQGVHFIGSPTRVDLVEFINIKNTHANYISLMPFAATSKGSNHLYHEEMPWEYLGESKEGLQTCIDLAKEKGMQTMIKPMIWLIGGGYIGDIDFSAESDWQKYEAEYKTFILEYAKLSEQNRLPLFCIGSELDIWAEKRPQFWKELIKSINEIYNGDLVYACRHGNEEKIDFWDALDYVGLTVYDSISNEETPSIDTLLKNWLPIKEQIGAFSKKVGKNVIFTEWGYTCSNYCGRLPDLDSVSSAINEQAQANCYDALLSTFEKEPWFLGGFVWKWFATEDHARNTLDKYSPQNKMAQKVLMKHWKK